MSLVTPNGKEIETYQEGFMTKVRFTSGGELPDELKGSWTTKVFAVNSINKYLEKLSKRPQKTKVQLNKEDYKR